MDVLPPPAALMAMTMKAAGRRARKQQAGRIRGNGRCVCVGVVLDGCRRSPRKEKREQCALCSVEEGMGEWFLFRRHHRHRRPTPSPEDLPPTFAHASDAGDGRSVGRSAGRPAHVVEETRRRSQHQFTPCAHTSRARARSHKAIKARRRASSSIREWVTVAAAQSSQPASS